jgi:transglutaminase-like putative cysteine protease
MQEGEPDRIYARRLMQFIGSRIRYSCPQDIALNNGHEPAHAFETGVAQCGRFAAIYASALRIAGVPARQVCGEICGLTHGNIHCVNDVFIKGTLYIIHRTPSTAPMTIVFIKGALYIIHRTPSTAPMTIVFIKGAGWVHVEPQGDVSSNMLGKPTGKETAFYVSCPLIAASTYCCLHLLLLPLPLL